MERYQYWVSFRLKENPSYEIRYQDLMQAIDLAVVGPTWSETTSFRLLTSNLTIIELAERLAGVIDTTIDYILIRRANVRQAVLIGTINDLDALKKFYPYVKSF